MPTSQCKLLSQKSQQEYNTSFLCRLSAPSRSHPISESRLLSDSDNCPHWNAERLFLAIFVVQKLQEGGFDQVNKTFQVRFAPKALQKLAHHWHEISYIVLCVFRLDQSVQGFNPYVLVPMSPKLFINEIDLIPRVLAQSGKKRLAIWKGRSAVDSRYCTLNIVDPPGLAPC